MKKYFFFSVLALMMAVSSCTEKYITEEYYTVVPRSITLDYTVFKDDWLPTRDDTGDILYYDFEEPEITQSIFDAAAITAFIKYGDGVYTPLMSWDPRIDYYNGSMWQEQFTYEITPGIGNRPGLVRFLFRASDHSINYPDSYPQYDYNFVIKILY